jgi:hypothetical protein
VQILVSNLPSMCPAQRTVRIDYAASDGLYNEQFLGDARRLLPRVGRNCDVVFSGVYH